MTLDDVLGSLFPAGHTVQRGPHHTVHGTGSLADKRDVALIGVVDGEMVGADAPLNWQERETQGNADWHATAKLSAKGGARPVGGGRR